MYFNYLYFSHQYRWQRQVVTSAKYLADIFTKCTSMSVDRIHTVWPSPLSSVRFFSLFPPPGSATIYLRPYLRCGVTILCIRDQWFLQNFINSMCDTKFWMDIENLKSVYKKPFFEILSGFLKTFFGCTFTKVICTFLKSVWKNGFLIPHST